MPDCGKIPTQFGAKVRMGDRNQRLTALVERLAMKICPAVFCRPPWKSQGQGGMYHPFGVHEGDLVVVSVQINRPAAFRD
jgi:hypothetical protein